MTDNPEFHDDPATHTDAQQADAQQISQKTLSPAAKRALAEAKARRETTQAEQKAREKELQGRAGPDPVRYGDWENKGIASDF
ncbi:MAG: DUF1674 domain-containing protein [Pseudomonadota bacterium]